MAYWCSRTLRERIPEEKLIVPYDPRRVKHSAYEMGVGREAYITSVSKERTRVPPGEKIIIPPGQFGLLTTREVVTVPADAIAFISIRAGIKFRGLVNVSGFHVDPGYKGHLKFAVYNAGSQPVVLDQKQPIFMIWFSELDDIDEEPYENKPRGQHIITSDDVTRIQGDVASPAELKKRIDELERKLANIWWLLSIIVIGIVLKGAYDSYQDSRKPSAVGAGVQVQQPQSSPALSPTPSSPLEAKASPATPTPKSDPTAIPQPPDAMPRKSEAKSEKSSKEDANTTAPSRP